ncbi:alpha/beta hydrolase [Cyanobacterium stanieri LEGE 03274]|uniref:Alpha/beta hydrolase n=1 Tax=Cyanobacterium stanieri LEGE 03274 TaxID=1828756 RepID=A0ABR9V163_9CHRO|nr:alpha/beta hydrolase [Cyanobacterium stanieri]MBE9221628.1 alpha/beta hydrolase [Cyanobacterium stanieri LEGE 03274]
MFKHPDVLWLNTNTYFKRFNLPIIKYLSRQVSIGQWEYEQNQDEGCSLEGAIALLDDYLTMVKKPVHLIGHSTAGVLGLLYARKYPEKIKSLTLLGVGVNPSKDWVEYYYNLRKNFPCRREIILTRLSHHLFHYQNHYYQKAFLNILDKALLYSLSPHSLYETPNITKGGIDKPLMVCGSSEDAIISPQDMEQWQPYLKKEDYLCLINQSSHFFHYLSPQCVGQQILKFLNATSDDILKSELDKKILDLGRY